MNVLVVNFYSSRNVGDHAILSAMIRLFRERGCDVRVIGDDPRDAARYDVPLLQPIVPSWPDGRPARRLRLGAAVARALATECDHEALGWANVCVAAGGGYLYDDGSRGARLNLALRLIPLRGARRRGVPVVFFSQSIGPFRHGAPARAVGHELSTARLVIARERYSAEVCRRLGVASLAECDDATFAFPSDGRGAERGAEIGLAVMRRVPGTDRSAARRATERIVDAVARAASRRTLGVAVISHVNAHPDDSDDGLAHEMTERLQREGLSARTVLLAGVSNDELLTFYRGLALVVAQRLHSAVVALAAGTPALALAYQPKARGIYERLGLPELVFPLLGFDVEALASAIVDAYDRAEPLRELVTRRVAAARASAERAADLALAAVS